MAETVSIERDGAAAARGALERCASAGGVAIFPADGVYGLACDPSREDAIQRIHALKGRGARQPSAVIFFSPLAMRELVATLGQRTRDVLAALLPGPVTLVVHNPERRYPNACRDDPERLGLRLIGGPLTGLPRGLFQTSANRTRQPPPRRFDDLDPGILAGVDLAIDGGELSGEPSTVVDATGVESGAGWTVLRTGAMPEEEVARRLRDAGVGGEPER